MTEYHTPNTLSNRFNRFAMLVIAMGCVITLTGCSNGTGGWFSRSNPKAARDPDPYRYAYNDKYASNGYSQDSGDPNAFHPVGTDENAATEGTDSTVNDYVARLQAAANSSDSPADPGANDSLADHGAWVFPGRVTPSPKPAPWITNAGKQNQSGFHRAEMIRRCPTTPLQTNPATQQAPVTSQAVATSARRYKPLACAAGTTLRTGESDSHRSTTRRALASSNVRAQQGMALDDLANSRDLQELIDAAKIEMANDPANPRKQMRLSLLQLANNQPEAAAQLSPAIGHRERELILQFVKSIGSVDSRLSDPLLDTDAVLASINDLRDSLRDTAELTIPTVALCSRVQTFGIYDEFPATQLRAHQVNRVIVYCEVDHFKSRYDDASGQFRTELGSHLELFTADGRSVWSQSEDQIVDLSRQQREDFFLAQLVSFPGNISSGEYVLKVAITDLQAHKTTEAVHRFQIQ
ncbi:MAG: hypothetical protein R3E58_13590 [Phycisphaerae bacterium]